MARIIRQVRCSIAASLVTAILAFPVVLVLTGLVTREVLIKITDSFVYGSFGLPGWIVDLIALISFVAPPILVAYLTSRIVYTNMRWKFIESDGRYCENCEYDLTGNVSGRCPECGSPVITRQPTDTANDEESTRAD